MVSNLQPIRVISLGLSVTVVLWVIWFGLHLPGLDLPPVAVGPVVLLGWLVLASLGARLIRPGLPGAALAGVITAALSLMAFGSLLVEQPDPSTYADGRAPLLPAAALMALGFLVLGAVIGGMGAALTRTVKAPLPVHELGISPWPSRLAWVVALSYVPLVLLGGLVTSSEAGMAVHGWPDTFGANMFLYPISLMSEPRIFLEHSHRLFGSLAGMATLILLLVVLVGPETRRKFAVWTIPLFIAVCVQGYLGGQRVVLNSPYLGALHGAFGQVVLAYAAVLALWMSPAYRGVKTFEHHMSTRGLRILTTGALHITLLQLLLGAMFRHLRRGDNPGAMHVLMTHIVVSLGVVTFAILAGSILLRFAKSHQEGLRQVRSRIRATGLGMHALVTLQFMLGWVALLVVMTGSKRGEVPTSDQLHEAAAVPFWELLVATAHQANGAAFLVVAMLGWAWGRRIHKASGGPYL